VRIPAIEDIGTRIAWVIPLYVVLFFVVNFILDNCFRILIPAHIGKPNIVMEFIATMILSALILAIYEGFSFYILLMAARREKAELEKHYVASQLEGLRNQVNPHFLFNSLNTLIYLIPEAPDKAVRFVQQLSKVYRYVLESRDEKVIPLKTELEFLQAYIFLLRERFGDNLRVDINNLEERQKENIVPLTLQMLLENAIKHNIISSEKPLKIDIFGENGHIVVRNNLQKKNQVMDSTGVGLDNIRARYQMLTDKEVKISASDKEYKVIVPFI
jgi:two-component system, LytTR family, sensor kinase